ncbi:MAG: lyase family protein [Fibrobacterota bacterium]
MRTEKDLLGETSLPDDALYGIHTRRGLDNFGTGPAVHPALIRALAEVKRAALDVNLSLRCIEPELAQPLIQACEEVAAGGLTDQFPLPALQGGAGTSLNMNMNEVIANRALQIMGYSPGRADIIHPVEIVNMHQSTNDVYPTALRIAVMHSLRPLSDSTARLQERLQQREQELGNVLMMGMTEEQEAVPITMGAQCASFAAAVERDRWRCFKAQERIRVINLGGTAVGTGITAPRRYILQVAERLRSLTGLPLSQGEFLMDSTANADSFVEVGATLTANAVNLEKIARDLRSLHSRGEISLKPVQAGSSIMPGKVNPVLCEYVISGSMSVRAQTGLIAEAGAAGSRQINEFLPLIADSLLTALDTLRALTDALLRCVDTLQVNRRRCMDRVAQSPTLITAFVPQLGYSRCEELVRAYDPQEGSFRAYLEKHLGAECVEAALRPESLMALGHRL